VSAATNVNKRKQIDLNQGNKDYKNIATATAAAAKSSIFQFDQDRIEAQTEFYNQSQKKLDTRNIIAKSAKPMTFEEIKQKLTKDK
jgi:hypothetical protein